MSYKLYLIEEKSIELFQGGTQDINGIDDANSINTLAQIAKKLMDGTLTSPGNMTVNGSLNVGGNLNAGGLSMIKGTASPDSAKIQWGDGTGWRLRFQKDDKTPVMDVYDNGNVNIVGAITASNRNILAELNNLNAKTANLNLGDFSIGQEGPFLVIRNKERSERWAYLKGTNWG